MVRLIEIVMGIWAAFICLVFALTIALTYYDKDRDKVPKALQQLMLINALLQLSDAVAWWFKGKTGVTGFLMVRISNYVYFLAIAMLGIAFCYYYDCVIEWFGEQKRPIFFRILKCIGLIFLLCLTVNLFTGTFYVFDASNNYSRTSAFVFIMVLQFIMLFVVVSEVVMYLNTSLKEVAKFHLAAFGLLLGVGIYQSLFYGLSLLNIAMSLVMVILYAVHMKECGDMQKKQAIKLMEQQRALEEQHTQLEETKEKLVEAKVQLLNAQIKPHFIYNTIALIRSYCYSEPETAADALGKFAKFLRGSIRSISATECISLKEELDIVQSYIYLQKKRFDDRLVYIEKVETTDCYLPALAIQILVENAVLHGIEDVESGGLVELHVFKEGTDTIITIRDNGTGFDTSRMIDEKTHIGIANVRDRLEKMCEGRLELESEIGKGTFARIVIPDREVE